LAWAAAGLALAVGIAVFLIGRAGISWPASRRSVAVLPFLNLTGDTGKDYFVDGFVDELTTSLAQTKGLHVVARSSAFQFRGKSPDIRVAGRQLGVATILEGSVSSAGGTVRVSAQLINVEDGFHVWSHTYAGAAEDVFTIRDQIARAVSGALDVSSPVRTAAAAYRPDLEAYDLYLKGQYFKERVTLDDLGRSIQFFEQSVHRDPGFAAAYAALADVYATVAYHQVVPEKESIVKAKAAAARALELDPALAEAHAVLAWIQCIYDWDWVAGEPGLRRALELNPNSARTHDWYSTALLLAGRFDQALSESKRALALDPLSYRVSGNISVILYCAHRYDEAIRQARQTLDINPHYYQANTMLGTSLAEKRLFPEAATALRAALADYPGDPDTMAHLAAVDGALGKRDEALKLTEELERKEPRPYYHLAFLYAASGDKDRAFDALDKAYAHRDGDMLSLNVDPAFDRLHADPRFGALWGKIGWK
jgi:TolB-like protein/Tfp pilus assembly protein PilF